MLHIAFSGKFFDSYKGTFSFPLILYLNVNGPSCVLQYNKQILIDAIVHAVNEDYVEMAGDFCRLGFLAPGTDITPIVPALEAIWQNSTGKGLADFNFRTVTGGRYSRTRLFPDHLWPGVVSHVVPAWKRSGRT